MHKGERLGSCVMYAATTDLASREPANEAHILFGF
jgi:hypothetical protein